jgi:hypothetical protein
VGEDDGAGRADVRAGTVGMRMVGVGGAGGVTFGVVTVAIGVVIVGAGTVGAGTVGVGGVGVGRVGTGRVGVDTVGVGGRPTASATGTNVPETSSAARAIHRLTQPERRGRPDGCEAPPAARHPVR